MRCKKMFSLSLAAVLGTAMPTAICASEDINVDIEADDYEENEEITQSEELIEASYNKFR